MYGWKREEPLFDSYSDQFLKAFSVYRLNKDLKWKFHYKHASSRKVTHLNYENTHTFHTYMLLQWFFSVLQTIADNTYKVTRKYELNRTFLKISSRCFFRDHYFFVVFVISQWLTVERRMIAVNVCTWQLQFNIRRWWLLNLHCMCIVVRRKFKIYILDLRGN